MTKQIFSTTDVAAEAACLRSRIVGYRVTNVYDAGASKVRDDCCDLFSLFDWPSLPFSHNPVPSLSHSLRPPSPTH